MAWPGPYVGRATLHLRPLMPKPPDPDDVGLPPRVFLYTLDQIAMMLELTLPYLKVRHVYFDGASVGRKEHYQMMARNIAPPDDKADWRVTEVELIRWLKHKRIRLYSRGWATS